MFVPGPTTIDQKTMRTTLRNSMLRAAILHECQNYLGGGGGLGGREKNRGTVQLACRRRDKNFKPFTIH